MSRTRESIKTLWTSHLRQWAAGFYAENKKRAAAFPAVSIQMQRHMARNFGLREDALSCRSCEGRGALCVIAQIHSVGGKVAGTFRSVLQCPECFGNGLDSAAYQLADKNHKHLRIVGSN